MSPATAKSRKAGGAKKSGAQKPVTYRLRLYVAGNEPNSRRAQENLAKICETYLNGNCDIETIDVLKDFRTAVKDNVYVAPALILLKPEPRVTILGNLSDTQKVAAALRLA